MDLNKFHDLYQNKFIVIYAELVTLTLEKPKQILIEISNVFAHLCQYHNRALDEPIREKNLEKAYNHLLRATLDLHKLVWAAQKEKLDKFIIKSPSKRLCFNISENEILDKYKSFENRAREARRYEEQHVGDFPEKSIDLYEEVHKIGMELWDAIDPAKVGRVGKMEFTINIKTFVTGTITSLVAGTIIGIFCSNWFSKLLNLILNAE